MTAKLNGTGQLDGRAIIVTGATKGIGRATALRLASEGARVVCTGRDEDMGLETVAQVRAAGGVAKYVRHDVRREADWAAVIAAAAEYGPLRGLVNNAGVFWVKKIEDTTADDFDQICQVNVEGTFLGVKSAFLAMAGGEHAGAIVNVSSLMGQVGFPDATAYCATKGAITGLTKAAAIEGAALTPKVRVNSLHPGVIWTPMITDLYGDSRELSDAFAADTPLRMIGLPEYMADAILFLISDDSSYTTGAELTVDGGRGAD